MTLEASAPSHAAPVPSHAAAPSQHLAMHHHHDTGHPSPPSKRDLKSWWKGFKLQPKQSEAHDTEVRSTGIFRVPLRQSITYANVAISLVDENGESYIYGYVPIVVAKCGVFLKEKATSIEGIFRLSGSEKRIKELKTIFDSPDRYGKGLVWDGYTVHDAANVLRRYLNDLPEPVVPLDLYEKFRDPLRGATRQAVGDTEGPHFVENFDEKQAIGRYQKLITELPPLNRQLLLYILDLLAVFAAKADENRMNSQNLAAIFQPGMLSHPSHAMAPEEYRLNQCVLIFLIENQDNFLIGMYGTAADEKTKKEVELGQHHQPSGLAALTTTTPTRAGDDQSGLGRSASNASAGAESVRRDGKIRRNRSTSSRHSRQSRNEPGRPGSTTPSSPAALTTTPTGGGGLTRSNTVPSKKSPPLSTGGRFQKDLFFGPAGAAAAAPAPAAAVPATAQPHVPGEFPVTPDEAAQMVVASPPTETSAAPSTIPSILGGGAAPLAYGPRPYDNSGPGRSQERLLDPPNTAVGWATPATTPVKEKKMPTLFARSPPSESDHRQPNKLKKKRAPGNLASAASSTTSLNQAASNGVVSPKLEAIYPADRPDPSAAELRDTLQAGTGVSAVRSQSEISSEPTPRASHVRSTSSSVHLEPKTAAAAANNKSNKSPPGSIHSSFNDSFLDFDQIDDQLAHLHEHPDRRKRWRLPRPAKHEDGSQTPGVMSPRAGIGSNNHAGTSSVSVGSGTRPRRSFTADSTDFNALGIEMHQTESAGREGRDESKGPIGWIRTKYREAKESVDHKRAKSPPSEQRHGTTESLESRTTDENPSHTGPAPANQQTVAFASRQPHQQRPPAQQAATASVRAVYADHTAPAP